MADAEQSIFRSKLKILYLIWYMPIFVLMVIIFGTVCVILSFLWTKLARYLSNVTWGYSVMWPAGVKIKTIGRENLPKGGGYIVYANHTSLADIPTLSVATGLSVTWVAKDALSKLPFFGWALARLHMLVDRGGGAEAAKKMVADASRRLNAGEILSIFPEGTRNQHPAELLPFKKGTFILAKHTKVPLVPIAICGTFNFWAPRAKVPNGPCIITVKIGEPFYPEAGEKLDALAKRSQDKLAELLGEIN